MCICLCVCRREKVCMYFLKCDKFVSHLKMIFVSIIFHFVSHLDIISIRFWYYSWSAEHNLMEWAISLIRHKLTHIWASKWMNAISKWNATIIGMFISLANEVKQAKGNLVEQRWEFSSDMKLLCKSEVKEEEEEGDSTGKEACQIKRREMRKITAWHVVRWVFFLFLSVVYTCHVFVLSVEAEAVAEQHEKSMFSLIAMTWNFFRAHFLKESKI